MARTAESCRPDWVWEFEAGITPPIPAFFGPDVRLICAAKPSFGEFDPADCAAADG